MVAGRSPEPRSVTVTTTNASAALTAAANTFNEEDKGRPISGTGIPAGATLSAVASDTAATLSVNATASGSITATLGGYHTDPYGFVGWCPESDAESETYTVAAVGAGSTPPDRITNAITAITRRARG